MLDLRHGRGLLECGVNEEADCVIGVGAAHLAEALSGRLDFSQAFSEGNMIIEGNMQTARRLQNALRLVRDVPSMGNSGEAA